VAGAGFRKYNGPKLSSSINPGIGCSSGETRSTVAALTKVCVEFCRALNLTRFDVLGFSLGGMIAQQLAADHPEMVRRIILLGTGPRGGEEMVFEELSVDELDDEAGLLMNAFFTQSEPSKAAGRAYLERLKLRAENRDAPVSKQAALAERFDHDRRRQMRGPERAGPPHGPAVYEQRPGDRLCEGEAS
jgi:pimeloyl-ACP methyl ester carboxylesterase